LRPARYLGVVGKHFDLFFAALRARGQASKQKHRQQHKTGKNAKDRTRAKAGKQARKHARTQADE